MEEEDIIIEEENENPQDLVKKLREKLKKCEAEKQEYLAGWQRAKADFINARREEEEMRQDFLKFSEKNLILDLLDLGDSFDALFKNKEIWEKIDENWRRGIENLYAQFMNILESRQVEVIENTGGKFNPEEHEAIEWEKLDNQEKDGIILEVLRRGYKMHNKIIRPAQVKIGKI